MDAKNILLYYPNEVESKNRFLKHLKNTEGFKDYCLGKDKWFYKDEGNYGTHRDRDHLTERERLDRDYLWNEFVIWHKWKQAGKNIFDFSQGLLDMLKETDVSDTDLQSIYLPYPNFYIDISAAEIPFLDDGNIFIEGVYIHEEINEKIDDDTTFEKVINLDFTGKYIENFKPYNLTLFTHVRGFHSYSLYLDRPYNILTIGAAVEDAKDLFVKVQVVDELPENQHANILKTHNSFIDRTIRLVINCLLYLTIKDKEVTESYPKGLPSHLLSNLSKASTSKKKQAAQLAITNAGFTKIKLVGKSFIRQSSTMSGELATHWRRGHWRNQRSGELLKDKNIIWIKPTIVNKEKGVPEKGHIYFP